MAIPEPSYIMLDMEDKLTREEIEFHAEELELMIRQYRLEDFGDALMKSVALIDKMIDWGVIKGSREGVMKGMEMIVQTHPDIDDSIRRFASAVFDKALDEIKQRQKPH